MPVASIEPVQPSLEDVFLDVVGTGGDDRCARRSPSHARSSARSARDRRTLMMLLFVPAFFLLLYGYALNFDIRHVRLGVDDRDRTAESRALVVRVRQLGLLRPGRDRRRTTREAIAADGPQRRCAPSLVHSRRARPGAADADRPSPVQVLLNGDNANTATTVMGYAVTIVRSESARYQPLQGRRPPPAGRRWSRASGTTRSCAARCSWCPGSSPTSR